MNWAVELRSGGSMANTRSKNRSIKRGLAYHRRVYRELKQLVKVEAPEQELIIEPWLRELDSKELRQPDAVLLDELTGTAIVIEVKLNWKDGRDERLINTYLAAVKSAYELEQTWPALVTSNVSGLRYKPRLGLKSILSCDDWMPGARTPVVLVP